MAKRLPEKIKPTNNKQTEAAKTYRGPLPAPAELSAYEQALVGAADRIITMAEVGQQAEIRELRFQQRAEFIIELFGQLFLYGLVIAAVFLTINDKPLEAFFAGLAPIALSIYASTRKKPNQEHDQNP